MLNKIWDLLKKYRRYIYYSIILCVIGVLFIAGSNIYTIRSTEDRLYTNVKDIPANNVGLLLGSRKGTWYFNNRVGAAAELFRAGKLKHIIVSGDNHIKSYDEPTDMKDALIKKGVPAECITCDYAGFRTLDSVIRAKAVFQQTKLTIISQKFHNHRALMIADKHGIDAVGYNADPVPWKYHKVAAYREYIARAFCFVDLYILNRSPKFLGEKETIAVASSTD